MTILVVVSLGATCEAMTILGGLFAGMAGCTGSLVAGQADGDWLMANEEVAVIANGPAAKASMVDPTIAGRPLVDRGN